jgi:hypothetical protein
MFPKRFSDNTNNPSKIRAYKSNLISSFITLTVNKTVDFLIVICYYVRVLKKEDYQSFKNKGEYDA